MPHAKTDLRQYIRDRIVVSISGCWEWALAKDRDGYGKASLHGKTVKAHRLSYMAFVNDLAPGEQVLHECDNTACCNPSHLFAGSHQDNVDDKVAKGRQVKGIDYWSTKLRPSDVEEIKRLYGTGLSQQQIAIRYDVSQVTISSIILNRSWAWLDRAA